MRIQWTRLTVKALHKRLQQAYAAGDKRLVRRLNVLLAVGQHRAKVTEVAQPWGLSPAIIDQWLREYVVARLASQPYRWGGGRQAKLTATSGACANSWMLAPWLVVSLAAVGVVCWWPT